MMKIPRHWSRAEGSVPAGSRGTIPIAMWGWSSTSKSEADALAQHRLQELVARGFDPDRRSGQYYPGIPVREEILQEILDGAGHEVGVVTRNRYGAEVLCTDAVLIADVDLPGPSGQRPRRSLLDRLRGRPVEDPAPSDALEIRRRVEAFAERNPGWGVHLHRTFAGFRVLITGSGIGPAEPRSREILEELGSDPLYMTLCSVQESYRARLTPKPWRLTGMRALPVDWPAEGRAADQRATWIRTYDERRTGRATTRRIWWNGVEPRTDGERRILLLHDERCSPDGGDPLG